MLKGERQNQDAVREGAARKWVVRERDWKSVWKLEQLFRKVIF